MNREDILRMGRQAGAFIELAQEKDLLWLERFADLVAKHTLANIDPSKFMSHQEGIEAGRLAERAKLQGEIETLYAMYELASKQRDYLMEQQNAQVAAMRGKMQ